MSKEAENKLINYLMRNNGSQHIVAHVGWHESGDYLLSHEIFSPDVTPYRQHKYEVEKEYNVVNKSVVENLERQTCGRRLAGENIDHWKQLPNGDKTCSFCGSLHPDSVLEIIKLHGFGVVQRTDKQYKWYVQRPSTTNAMDGGIKYYRHHDTTEFIKAYNELLNQLNSPK